MSTGSCGVRTISINLARVKALRVGIPRDRGEVRGEGCGWGLGLGVGGVRVRVDRRDRTDTERTDERHVRAGGGVGCIQGGVAYALCTQYRLQL